MLGAAALARAAAPRSRLRSPRAIAGHPPRRQRHGRSHARARHRDHLGGRRDPGGDRDRRRFSRTRPGWSGSAPRLKRAGIEDRDIQTSNISLNPEYRYVEEPAAAADRLHAHRTHVSVRFRDIANAGEDPRRAGRRGRQPDQRPDADDRQARSSARRGARPRRSPSAARAPSSMPARWGCGWCG